MKLNLDGPFFTFWYKAVDCLLLTCYWMFFSIPIVTMGASTTALYYSVNKTIKGDRGYLFSTYWGAFKSNFKKATPAWLILLLLGIFVRFDMDYSQKMLLEGEAIGNLYYAFFVLAMMIIGWGIYLFPYIARFEDTLKVCMKNSAIMMIVHLPWSLVMVGMLMAGYVTTYLCWPIVFVLPTVYVLFCNGILEKIFRKYMSKADLEKEIEQDMLRKQ